MKRVFFVIIFLISFTQLWAQTPNQFSYQAVIRNSSNELIKSAPVGMKISILQGSTSSSSIYEEKHTPNTNENGLITLEVGNGTAVKGDFSTIDWSNGPFFIKTEVDPTGGTSYSIEGITQLLSVPFSLHAKNTDSWKANSSATSYSLRNLAIGTNVFKGRLHVHDRLLWLSGETPGLVIEDTTSTGHEYALFSGSPLKNHFKIRDNTMMEDRLIIDDSGNIGVGTTPSINAKLHVKSSGFSNFVLESTGSITDGSIWLSNPSYTWRIHGDQSTGNLFRLGLWDKYGGSAINNNIFNIDTNGNIGIKTLYPQRTLHVSGVMRLDPRSSAPSSPKEGDMYMSSITHKLMVYDGTTWQACW